MKRIASVRQGLARIPGAMRLMPPTEGYEGIEEAVRGAQTIWPGERDETAGEDQPMASAPIDSDQDLDDGDFDEGTGDAFDPVLEIGAEVDERFPGLGGTEGRKIAKSVEIHGIDALGWYMPFHAPGAQWGIYIPITGLVYLIDSAFGRLQVPLATKMQLAFHAIYNHELFHFATEYAIAQAELVHHRPWFIPAKAAFSKEEPSYCVEEEQMANAYMLAAFRSLKPALKVKGKQAALQAFVKNQPVGYRDALDVRRTHWSGLLDKLAHRYGEHAKRASRHRLLWKPTMGFDWAQAFPIQPKIDWRHCPIHVVNDGSRLGLPSDWLQFFARLVEIKETSGFQKKLQLMDGSIQRAWERMKQKLGVAITSGADFKPWPKDGDDCYSVRINNNFRAHLKRQRDTCDWLAYEIGSHKAMGHG